MTALTLYPTQAGGATSTTLSTAQPMLENPTTNATNVTNKNTNLNSGTTGWVELTSQGSAAVSGAGSQPSPSGKGWFDDASGTTLAGAHFASGTWTATVELENTTTGTITFDLHCRVYQYSTTGATYTLIAEMIATGQSITSSTAYTQYTATATGVAASNQFASTDRLYLDHTINITANSTTGNIRIHESNSATIGYPNVSLTTPGYVTSTLTDKKWVARLYQYAMAQRKFASRLYHYVQADKPFTTRFNQFDFHKKWNSRFYQYVHTDKLFVTRLKQVGLGQHSYVSRFGQYDPNSTAQMLYDDLQQQYNRLRAASTNSHIILLALVYYTSAQVLSEHALPGELDVLLSGENIATDLHVLKTVADVTAFIAAHP